MVRRVKVQNKDALYYSQLPTKEYYKNLGVPFNYSYWIEENNNPRGGRWVTRTTHIPVNLINEHIFRGGGFYWTLSNEMKRKLRSNAETANKWIPSNIPNKHRQRYLNELTSDIHSNGRKYHPTDVLERYPRSGIESLRHPPLPHRVIYPRNRQVSVS